MRWNWSDEIRAMREKRKRLNYLKEQIELHREINPRIGQMFYERAGAGFAGAGGVDKLIVKIESLCEDYDACLASYLRDYDKIYAKLKCTLSTLEMQIIEFHYLHDKDWSDVCEMLNISASWMFKLHKRALDKLDSER